MIHPIQIYRRRLSLLAAFAVFVAPGQQVYADAESAIGYLLGEQASDGSWFVAAAAQDTSFSPPLSQRMFCVQKAKQLLRRMPLVICLAR